MMAERTSICVGGPLDGRFHTADSDHFKTLVDKPDVVGVHDRKKTLSHISYRWLQLTPGVLPIWVPAGQSISETVGLLIGGYKGVIDG